MGKIARTLLIVAAVAGLVTSVQMAQEAGKDYQIKFLRPEKVGDKCTVTGTGAVFQKMTATVGDQPGKTNETRLEFETEGTQEVLAVDALGQATKIAFTVVKFNKVADGKSTELVAKDKVILVSREADKKVTRLKDSETPLTGEAALVADTALGVSDPNQPTDDEVFGAKDRKKVGESWPINADKAVQGLKVMGLDVPKENISGQAKLAGLVKVAGVECLNIAGEMTVKDFKPPGIPPNMTVEKSQFKVNLAGAFPLDVSRQPLTQSQTMTMEFQAASQTDAGKAVITMKEERALSIKTTPVEKK